MSSQTNKRRIDEYARNLAHNRHMKWIIAIVFFAVIFSIIFIGVSPNQISLKEGEVAKENIVAPRRIVDVRMTNALRLQAENLTAPVYDYIPTAYAQSIEQINQLFITVSAIRPEYLTEEDAVAYNSILNLGLTLEDYKLLAGFPDAQRDALKAALLGVSDKIYNTEIKAESLETSKKNATDMVLQYQLEASAASIAQRIIYSSVRPNMIYNEEATNIAKKTARDSVGDVVYETGQTIIKKGDVVSEHVIMLLKDSGMMRAGLFDDVSSSIGLPSLILILIGLYASYLYFFHHEIFIRNKYLTLIALQFILMLIVGQLCGYFSVYLIPVSILTMSLSVIFGPRVAVQTNLFFTLFLAAAMQLDIDAVIYLSVSGYMGIVYMRRVGSRNDLLKSGIVVSIANVVIIVILSVLRSNINIRLLNYILYGIGSGLISATFTSGMLMLWEQLFNIATPFKLLEMSSPNDYVIQRLIADAPGTYHHSLIVSNMAETAAKKIGANSLLTRVGAYYHDIGKAEKAIYFRENQTNVTNPHDFIAPEVSAKIIKNHVADGIYLAEKYRIPEEVEDFIKTHHGTSEISLFKAKAAESGYAGDEDFNYHTVLPASKETSIVMLADSIEAAVRSLENQDAESIKKMILTIVNKKINEGQLKKSKLSFFEIEQIKESFLEVLSGVYHSRIKYPNQPDEGVKT